jgi:hypothetical protein
MRPDPKPAARIVNPNVQPLDALPLRDGRCPLCRRRLVFFSRHHVLPKGQSGDDVPENTVWTCGDGTRGCHGVLTHRNRDGESGRTFEEVAADLLRYLDTQPLVRAYAEGKKYPGWLEDYYATEGRKAA